MKRNQGMYKQCRYPGCGGLTFAKYCDKHAHLAKQEVAEQNRYYNNNVRDNAAQKFYESPAWRKLRKIKLGQMPMCEICFARGRCVPANIVDHKVEIKDGGAPLDLANLVSTCRACHNVKTAKERKQRNKK